ncbi:MAG: hypothetical protein J6C00_11000 [Eubacterium sp.]|nr:hypothetical protein [Eubacterium sp.]
MDYCEFLKLINKKVEKYALDNNHSRNYIHIIRPYEDVKLNIIGSFRHEIEKEENTCRNFTIDSKCSFGIVPIFQFTNIKEVLYRTEVFSDKRIFHQYIKKYSNYFVIDEDEYKRWKLNLHGVFKEEVDKVDVAFCKEALFARCILFAVRNYGIKIEITKYQKNLIFDDEANVKIDLEDSCELRLEKINDDRYSLLVLGCPIGQAYRELTQILDKDVRYYYKNDKYHYTRSTAIYSGVLPRLLNVHYSEPTDENSRVAQLELELGQTSYLTEAGLESYEQIRHKFMKIENENGISYEKFNNIYDMNEVFLVEKYINGEKDIENCKDKECINAELSNVNCYLQHSLSVHNINVSAVLITSDGYCIYTKRNSEMSDSEHIYCSINGGAEIFDSQVLFYTNKMEEDKPTIKYGKESVYFSLEITREGIAELGLGDNSSNWNYLGLSAMAGRPSMDGKHRTWLHFNILAEKSCLDKFEQIRTNRLDAVECFENSNIFGYQLCVHTTLYDLVIDYIRRISNNILANKDFILYLLLIVLSINKIIPLDGKCMVNVIKGNFVETGTFIIAVILISVQSVKYLYKIIKGSSTNQCYVYVNLNNKKSICKGLDFFIKPVKKSKTLAQRIRIWWIHNINRDRAAYRSGIGPEYMLFSMLRLLSNVKGKLFVTSD